jgi:hypothetical protein
MRHILYNASKDEEISQCLEIPEKQAGTTDADRKEKEQKDNLSTLRCHLAEAQPVPILGVRRWTNE